MLRWLLLLPIKLYWIVIPANLRRSCLFRVSCSRHVYEVARSHGLVAGLVSLWERSRQCRPGYRIDVSEGSFCVVLANGMVVSAEAVTEDVLAPYVESLNYAKEQQNKK